MSRKLSLKEALLVYAIIDPGFTTHDILFLARELIAGGVRCIQYRDKISSDFARYENASALRQICSDSGAYLFINDRVDLAVASGADGVHLGPDDLPVELVKRTFPELLIGASAGSVQRAQTLEKKGADYLGVGAIFEARTTKKNASAPRGLEVVQNVSYVLSVPIVGIGGINLSNASEVVAAGAAGIAVVSSLISVSDPRRQTKAFFKVLELKD